MGTKRKGVSFDQRFWSKVDVRDKGECWEWLGSKRGGYGQIQYKRKNPLAHRVAYLLTHGSLPDSKSGDSEKTQVLHTCDNKTCCNPDHLYLGNHSDNTRDAVLRGRYKGMHGADNSGAKLSPSQVDEIKMLYANGRYRGIFRDMASTYGVNAQTIANIVQGKRWASYGQGGVNG